MKRASKWISLNPEFERLNEKPAQRKVSKPEKKFTATQQSFNFEKELEPKSITDLAVQKRKIKEVEQWFEDCTGSKPKKHGSFLLMTGPSGCGKTATLKVLCNTNNLKLSEWINPIDQDFEYYRGPGQVACFLNFLLESQFKSLRANKSKRVVMVKEFPNALLMRPEEFQNVLEQCFYNHNIIIVFICTKSFGESKNTADVLFTDDIRAKYRIPEISFNSCTNTLLKAALKRAEDLVTANSTLFQVPASHIVDAIVSTSMGDIRSAISQYYFASLRESDDLPTTCYQLAIQPKTKRKRTENKLKINFMKKDEMIGLFHGLGRVLNPRFIEIDGTQKLDCDIQKLVDEFSVQPNKFLEFLFENYVNYFGNEKDIYEAAELLSFGQRLVDTWNEHNDIPILNLWIMILGIMLTNTKKVAKWNQIKGPTKIKKNTNDEAKKLNLNGNDMFYYNIIKRNEPNMEAAKEDDDSDDYTIDD